jgi:NAD(P)-dependent dehydrogenase (short-subunit alcohol dehydrogenase family)
MSERQVAVIVGVGPGLGFALVRRFASAGMAVAMAARDRERLEQLLQKEPIEGAKAYACDATDRAAVDGLFAEIDRDLGAPLVAVFNAGAFEPGGILEIDPAEFERCWRIGCLAGFLVGQAAARRMVAKGHGTILFTGATAALRGSARFANLVVPKFGLRALAQTMARELDPQGIHVGHVAIDGQIPLRALRPSRGRARPRFAARARCHRRDVLPAAHAAEKRLDARARPPALEREVLRRERGQDELKPLFERGGTTVEAANFLFRDHDTTLAEEYWRWVKNQAIEKTIPFAEVTQDPCQIQN